ncbi:hypothetical protein J6590_004099 [Homalodisca vitripennis]|nr:hypothetical protein J6590_004099 [Homalodisca vitripennis]
MELPLVSQTAESREGSPQPSSSRLSTDAICITRQSAQLGAATCVIQGQGRPLRVYRASGPLLTSHPSVPFSQGIDCTQRSGLVQKKEQKPLRPQESLPAKTAGESGAERLTACTRMLGFKLESSFLVGHRQPWPAVNCGDRMPRLATINYIHIFVYSDGCVGVAHELVAFRDIGKCARWRDIVRNTCAMSEPGVDYRASCQQLTNRIYLVSVTFYSLSVQPCPADVLPTSPQQRPPVLPTGSEQSADKCQQLD